MRGPPMPQRHQSIPISQQNSWNQSMAMNTQSLGQMDGGQLAPQQQWMNQSFQNGIPAGMNNLGLSYLPQNVLQDALALSVPVESADEPLLVQQIMNGLPRGETYKEILNSLHGKNGHSASLWKDYYLDHKTRIDSWVNMCMQKEKPPQISLKQEERGPIPSIKKPTIKKPSPRSFKTEHSPVPISLTPSIVPAKRPHSNVPTPKEQRSTPAVSLAPAGGSKRATINSLTAPAPVFDSRLPPPHADIKIPDPPSRSPTPPTRVIPQGRGNKYTPEDREFFIKFIQRALQKNPDLTRNELCEMVAERAPHHTAQSWASHWSINHDLPDKILAAARGQDYALAEEEEDEARTSRRKRPKYRDPSTSGDEGGDENEQESASVSNNDEDESDDDTPVKQWHEDDMGQKGEPFSEADMYIAAKYIAEFPRWHETTSKDRWGPFSEKYTQRSAKSWAEYYRRCDKEINREGIEREV
ncbi:hypothetical protein EST38_g6325 [Candolleomyces aberdarensis]|uniref:DNA-binding protein RAP1 n=1 Tax=Candolleomyces aberdarensis TaxID=2316362 RepID=A0A4Q2DJZ7_9AGAR|nr:hypothetical protein EST38_g6325 [Candolleomyces aberdarensis]